VLLGVRGELAAAEWRWRRGVPAARRERRIAPPSVPGARGTRGCVQQL